MSYNPYLPSKNNEGVMSLYDRLPDEKQFEMQIQRKPLFSKAYESVEEVEKALKKDVNVKVYAGMSKELRMNEDNMLHLIKKDAQAYIYAPDQLKAKDIFNEKVIKNNTDAFEPIMYSAKSMSQEQKDKLNELYLQGKEQKMKTSVIDHGEKIMYYDSKLSKDFKMPVAEYERRYKEMLEQGPLKKNENGIVTLDKNVAYLATARHLNPENAEKYDKAEKEALTQYIEKNPEKIKEMVKNQNIQNKNVLEAIQERCPERKEQIQEIYREQMIMKNKLEETKRQEAQQKRELELKKREQDLVRLSSFANDKKGFVMEQLLREQEQEKRSKEQKEQRLQKEREAEMAYFKQAAIDSIYGRAAAGDIDINDAATAIGMISNIPNKVGASKGMGMIATISAEANDYQDRDKDREDWLKATSNPSAIDIAKDAWSQTTGVERDDKVIEESYEYDGDWKHSKALNIEMTQEYQFNSGNKK